MFGFQFLPHIYDMMSFNPISDRNIDYNLNLSKQMLYPSLFMMPNNYGAACIEYPLFGLYGDKLLDGNLAIQQAKHEFNNFDFNSKFDFNHIFDKSSKSNNSNNNSTSVADKVKQADYDTLKSVLEAYKNSNSFSPAMKAKIEAALSKSGSYDEKLSALKDVLKTLPADKLKLAVLSDEKLKAKLASCGYNLSDGKLNKQDDAKLRGLLESVKQELNNSPAKYDTLLAKVCSSEADPDILRKISYWNDNNTNIIKIIAGKINKTKGEGNNQKTAVNNIAMSLINKSNEIQENYSSDFTKLKAAQKDVSDALAKVNGNSGFTKTNLEALATKFDKLYAMLRITEASAVSSDAKTEFQKVLNDATGKTVIPDDFIVAETKADLTKEKVTIPEVDGIEEAEIDNNDDITSIEIDEMDTVEEKIEALKGDKGSKSIVDSAKQGVYKTNATSNTEKPQFYYVKDDKILELKDVVDIDANGKCTMKDGTIKELKDAKANSVEVQPSSIMQYKATLERIEKLIKDKDLIPCNKPQKVGNDTLYRSKGKNLQGNYQYFVVKDGKLMQIKCTSVNDSSTIKTEAGNKPFAELTDDDFTEINDSDILKEDEKEEKEEKVPGSKEAYVNTVTVEADTNPDKPSEAGKVLRQRLHNDTNKTGYNVVDKKIKEFGNYTETEDIVSFIEGYNDEKDPLISWNDELCAQISTEDDYDTSKKENALKTIAQQILKVMDELGISKDSKDYTDMKYYAENGPKREKGTFWSTWSFWNSERTGVANHMDDIIERVLEQYRKEHPASETNS